MKTISTIAEANDEFRNKLRTDSDHKVIITEKLSASGFYSAAIAAVRTFHKFEDNNVLRDFGRFLMLDRQGYFKIEYCDHSDWSLAGDPMKGPVKRKITIGFGEV